MRKIFFLSVLLISLAACGPTMQERNQILRQQIETAEIAPLPSDWQDIAKAALLKQLKDPASAQFDFSDSPAPTKWAYEERVGVQPLFGWQIICKVNAKNSYGGYTGFTPWSVNLVDGKAFQTFPREFRTRSGYRITY